MAPPIAEIPLMSLEEFREVIGYHPFHFWGLSGALAPLTSECNSVVRKYAWQGVDAAGRDDILRAIYTAEERLREQLGYPVAPRFIERTVQWPELWNSWFKRWGYAGSANDWVTVEMPDARIQAAGVEKLTLIGTATVTRTDTDSDGLKDTFTLSIATSVTDVDKLALYFIATDRLNSEAAGERWRIKPVRVSIAAGIATFTGRSWQLVKPILYEGLSTAILDPATDSNFVTSLEVYERKVDVAGITEATVHAVLTWQTQPWPNCCSVSNANDPAATATALARVSLRAAREGVLGIGEAVYNGTQWIGNQCLTLCRPPDLVTVRYVAGDPISADARVLEKWKTIVARFACAEMMRRICACDAANREIYQWQLDMARAGGIGVEQFKISEEDLRNPFGTHQGQVYAWRAIKSIRHVSGILA